MGTLSFDYVLSANRGARWYCPLHSIASAPSLKEGHILKAGKASPENTGIKQQKASVALVFPGRLIHILAFTRHSGPQLLCRSPARRAFSHA